MFVIKTQRDCCARIPSSLLWKNFIIRSSRTIVLHNCAPNEQIFDFDSYEKLNVYI